MGTAGASVRRWVGAGLLAPAAVVTAAAAATPAVAASTCSATNAADVVIVDTQTVESAITLSGCTGNASATSTVDVHIVHSYRGDLVVSLVAPDGSAYPLSNRAGGSADNIDQTYTLNLSTEARNGTWRLRVYDAVTGDNGFLNSWGIDAGAVTAVCSGTSVRRVPITDMQTAEDAIAIAGCTGNGSTAAAVEVHISHTYRGDLVVSLVAPDGSVYVLSNRMGGSTDNIDQIFHVNLSSEVRNGTWRLRVYDGATGDFGYINGWTLTP